MKPKTMTDRWKEGIRNPLCAPGYEALTVLRKILIDNDEAGGSKTRASKTRHALYKSGECQICRLIVRNSECRINAYAGG